MLSRLISTVPLVLALGTQAALANSLNSGLEITPALQLMESVVALEGISKDSSDEIKKAAQAEVTEALTQFTVESQKSPELARAQLQEAVRTLGISTQAWDRATREYESQLKMQLAQGVASEQDLLSAQLRAVERTLARPGVLRSLRGAGFDSRGECRAAARRVGIMFLAFGAVGYGVNELVYPKDRDDRARYVGNKQYAQSFMIVGGVVWGFGLAVCR